MNVFRKPLETYRLYVKRLFTTYRPFVIFVAKMTAVLAVWYIVYNLWLLPDGRLDAWLSVNVAAATAKVLSPFFETAVASGRDVFLNDVGIRIVNGCNGLDALSLFVGFVIAYPGTWRRRALFIPAGLVFIVVVNILRCASLLIIADRFPEHFDSVHGFHALWIFYVAIFLLWMLWARIGGHERRQEETTAQTVPA